MACNGKEKQKKEDEQYARIEQQDEKTIVKAQVAREDRFNLELVSNGKAEANRKATLNFDVADVVKKVNVKNGDRIRKGDIIAEVDDEKAKQTLEDALLSLKKAVLDLKLSIINEGFKTLDDTIKLTALRKEAMYLQCGYTSSLKAFEKAEKEYTLSNLTVNALHAALLGLLVTIILPILLLAGGIVIFMVRRKK